MDPEDFEWNVSNPFIAAAVEGKIVALSEGESIITIKYPFDSEYAITLNVKVIQDHAKFESLSTSALTNSLKNLKLAIEESPYGESIETALDKALSEIKYKNKWGWLISSLLVEKAVLYPNFSQVQKYIPEMAPIVLDLSNQEDISLVKSSVRGLALISKSNFEPESESCLKRLKAISDKPNDSIREEIAYSLRYYKKTQKVFKDLMNFISIYTFDGQEKVRENLIRSISYFNKEIHFNDYELTRLIYKTYLILANDPDENIISLSLYYLTRFVSSGMNISPDFFEDKWDSIFDLCSKNYEMRSDKGRENTASLFKQFTKCGQIELQLESLNYLAELILDNIESVRYEALRTLISFNRYGANDAKNIAKSLILLMKNDESKRISDLAKEYTI